MKTIIIGGGAAGFFLAINLKEMVPGMDVTIIERSQHLLNKVSLSGGGRCNCTNTFQSVEDLKNVYPRGHRLMKRLFRTFGPQEAREWFEAHGVRLTAEPDGRIFPATQQAQTIVDCLLTAATRLGVHIRCGEKIAGLDTLGDYDYVCVTTGGQPYVNGLLKWLADAGHAIEKPVPSLLSLSIDGHSSNLQNMMGVATEHASVMLPGTKFRTDGALLITHWGFSGPAILKLSSFAARHLAECKYHATISINWMGQNDDTVHSLLRETAANNPKKQLANAVPQGLSSRLWSYLVWRSLGEAGGLCSDLHGKRLNKLVNTICNDIYSVNGQGPYKDEFVTCGGISLTSVNPATLESRVMPRLYFAGEVLDVDGITGGFNFQAAWTTAYTVAKAICNKN